MEENKKTVHVSGGLGCGCLSLITTFLLIGFCCTCLVKSCERGSLWEGCVETVHDYYEVVDTTWNK